ncbi:hypothetical protein AC249_AIPGENE6133 [Exaiptasia diaphana]|nr:hypothetical protein AC249_AIPGENE6133 [Exaiptasia diaphana]
MKRLSDDIRWKVIYHELIYGSSIKETCRALFVEKTFVCKIRQLYKRTGNVAVHTRRGRPRLLTWSDILYLQCRRVVKRNGIIFLTKLILDLCESDGLDCPLMKGETYTLTSGPKYFASAYCLLPKGHYSLSVSCADQNNLEVACAMLNFTWTN